MNETKVQRIMDNPKFQTLVRKKSGFAAWLTVIVLVIYYGFILVLAFWPSILAAPITSNSFVTVGIPVGVGVILSAFFLTGIYVWRSNTVYDRLTNDVIEEVSK